MLTGTAALASACLLALTATHVRADVVGLAMVHGQEGRTAGQSLILSDAQLNPPPVMGSYGSGAATGGAGAQVAATASGFIGAAANVLSSALAGAAEQITGLGEATFKGAFDIQSDTLAVGEVAAIDFAFGLITKALLEKNTSVDTGNALSVFYADLFLSFENMTAVQQEDFMFTFLGEHPDLETRFRWSFNVANPLPTYYEMFPDTIVAPVGATLQINFRADVVSSGKAAALTTQYGTQAGLVRSETRAGMAFGARALPFSEGAGLAALNAAAVADEITIMSRTTGLELAGLDHVNEIFLTEHLAALAPSPVPLPGTLLLMVSGLPALAWRNRRKRRFV